MLTTTKIASPLSRKATLVSVEISQWSARKLDRKVTDEVNQAHNASKDAGRYNKRLIAAEHLEKIQKYVSEARTLHYTLTKPWADEGMRILPNVLHEKFATAFREIKRNFDQAADEFCIGYPQFIEERKRALNGLFNESDYPSVNDIRGKFKLKHRTFPVPEADDFRSDVLDEDTVADIKRELNETSDQVLTDAMAHTAKQLSEVIGNMATKLKDNDEGERQIFRDSLVENVRELAELLPAFNFTNDPKMDSLTKRIQRELCAEDAKTLRENKEARETVRKSADDILKDVSSLLG